MTSWKVTFCGALKRYFRPLLIWSVPNPSDVASPAMVAKMARMSMVLPSMLAFPFSPSTGRNMLLISPGAPLRYWKKARQRAMTAYPAHGWRPQWKKVVRSASSAAFALPAAAPKGGVMKW